MGSRRRKASAGRFYGDALPAEERRALLRALQQRGCEGEIALLRLGIRRMLEQEDIDMEGVVRIVNVLVRALRVQQQMGDGLANGLADALATVLEEITPTGGTDGAREREQ